jgi:hypothetical protein
MRKHIIAGITTVFFVVGLYTGNWARETYLRKK